MIEEISNPSIYSKSLGSSLEGSSLDKSILVAAWEEIPRNTTLGRQAAGITRGDSNSTLGSLS